MKRLIKKANVENLHDLVYYWDGTKENLEEIREASKRKLIDEYYYSEDEVISFQYIRGMLIENDRLIAWFDPAWSHYDESENHKEHVNFYISPDSDSIRVEYSKEIDDMYKKAGEIDDEQKEQLEEKSRAILNKEVDRLQIMLPLWYVIRGF